MKYESVNLAFELISCEAGGEIPFISCGYTIYRYRSLQKDKIEILVLIDLDLIESREESYIRLKKELLIRYIEKLEAIKKLCE